ncbi:MAG: hypothetical protein CVT93_09540 [Bacteroidetes bacterium HGW-Bacteroidetes-10]|nr:MAG: hypothetical protein CVT93_09540 [Bacteroidetes bacterium HGW-Bacteroidetes-10]
MLLADIQLVTAVRVSENLTLKTHSKPLPGNEHDLLHASLKNLCQRLTPAGHLPGTIKLCNGISKLLIYGTVRFAAGGGTALRARQICAAISVN